MKSKVYFTGLSNMGKGNSFVKKIEKIFDASDAGAILTDGDLTAIKLHFGEPGNTAYLHPTFVRKIVDKVKERNASPFLTDSNTLYFGGRDNSVNHLNSAIKNGFAYAVVDAPLIIADGLRGKNTVRVRISKKHFEDVLIAGEISQSDSMVVLSHVKGHDLAGFGGAVKNIAMGCASAAGKQQQHSTTKPVIESYCIGCKRCIKWCPVTAITVEEKQAKIDYIKCIGCGECIAMCPVNAIKPQWSTDESSFQERMVEYAYGAVADKMKNHKVIFINFVINVTPNCDCKAWSEAPIVPDVGILVSRDPVAIDKASCDLINRQIGNKNTLLTTNHEKGKDKFAGIQDRNIDINIQFQYGKEIGLGNTDYELIEV